MLPIIFQLIGGVIAYYVIKNDSPRMAKDCLYIGIVLTAINLAFTGLGLAVFEAATWEIRECLDSTAGFGSLDSVDAETLNRCLSPGWNSAAPFS